MIVKGDDATIQMLTNERQTLADAAKREPLQLPFEQARAKARRHQREAHPGKGQQREEEWYFGVLQRVMANSQARQHRQAHHVTEDVRRDEQCGGIQLRHQQRLLQRHHNLIQQIPPQVRCDRQGHAPNAMLPTIKR